MNNEQAKQWQEAITELLTDKELISVTFSDLQKIVIRQNQKFNQAYIVEHSVEHSNDNCVVAVSDTYGIMTGAEEWRFSDLHGIVIRQNQKFNQARIVKHSNDNCVVAVSDTYGVMTGAEKWRIDPDKRTVHAETTNGFGEPVYFSWAIVDKDEDGKIWRQMKKVQKELWQFTSTAAKNYGSLPLP